MVYEESEIAGSEIQQDLELQLEYLRVNSSPVTKELVAALKTLRPHEAAAYAAKKKLASQFEMATKDIPSHSGLATYGPATKTTAFTRFTTEWNETLELLRSVETSMR